MAYNPYPYYQQMQAPQQIQQMQSPSNGLIPVPSEMVARNYPVAFGQSVSFKDENLPFLYTKTMGFSQLEPPRFEKYRLVKEEIESAPVTPSDADTPAPPEVTKADIKAIWDEINAIKFRMPKTKKEKEKEVENNDAESK